MASIQPCPFLPVADFSMNWRSLNSTKKQESIQFYIAALKYAQVLWLRNLPARSLLAVDRALLTDLTGNEAELTKWPLPYRSSAWIVQNYRTEDFVGNPRVHFQHLATRVRGERKDQRMWRAWACWYLTRLVRPDLPGDEKQGIEEPTYDSIHSGLATHGIPNELDTWESVVSENSPV